MDRRAAKELLHIEAWHDEINRMLTWETLSGDLPAWRLSLQPLFGEAGAALLEES